MIDYGDHIVKLLRSRREALGLSTAEIAAYVGIEEMAYCDVENYPREFFEQIDLSEVCRILDKLSLSLEELFELPKKDDYFLFNTKINEFVSSIINIFCFSRNFVSNKMNITVDSLLVIVRDPRSILGLSIVDILKFEEMLSIPKYSFLKECLISIREDRCG